MMLGTKKKKHILGQGVGACKTWSWDEGGAVWMERRPTETSASKAKGWWRSWESRGREGREGPGSPEDGQWGRHLQQQLNNVHVHQPQDRLPIDVGDEVSSSQARLLGGTPLLHALRGNGGVSCLLQQQETPASCCLSCCLFP